MKTTAGKTLPKAKSGSIKKKSTKSENNSTLVQYPVSSHLLELLTEKAPYGLYIYNLQQARNIYANKQVEAIFGCTQKELLKERSDFFIKRIHPDDLHILESFPKQVKEAKKGETICNTYRIKTNTGRWRWIQSRDIVITRDKKGKPLELLGTAIDITKQKNAEDKIHLYQQKLEMLVEKKTQQYKETCLKLKTRNQDLLKLQTQVKISEEIYRNLVDSAKDIIFTLGKEGTILSLNPVFEKVTGWKRKDYQGKPVYSLIHPEEEISIRNSLKNYRAFKQLPLQYYRLRKKDGNYLIMEVTGNCLKVKDGSRQVLGVARDLTERMSIQDALQDSEAINTALLNASPDGAMIVNKTGEVLSLNNTMATRIGLPREKLIGMKILDYLPPAISKERNDQIRKVIESTQPAWFEETKNGTHLNVVIYPIVDKNKSVEKVAIFVRDITEFRRIEEALRSLSLLDDLTGLHNRRGFVNLGKQFLKMAQRQGKNLVLFFADLDGMKHINDEYGHREGDWALKKVGDVLRDSFRKSDLLARIGGDEFVVLAMESQDFRVDSVVERIKSGLSDINKTSGKPVQLALSVGWKKYDPANPAMIDDLLESADRAMYDEKKRKKV